MRSHETAGWVACAALAGALLVGCGDDDGGQDAASSTTAESPSTTGESPSTTGEAPPTRAASATTGSAATSTAVTESVDSDAAEGDCPLVSSADLSTILGTDVTIAPDGVVTDPAGVSGTSCAFGSADSTVVVSTLLYDEPPPGLLDAEIANLENNDVSYVDVDDLGSRAIASGSGGTVNVSAEADGWYLIVSLVTPGEEGGDPFSPDADALVGAAAAARAMVD